LVRDLNEKPDSVQKEVMIKRAEGGSYHCLKSQMPAPKIFLHSDCILSGYDDIAEKVFEGEYDEI
jgi:hypothetical protein